MPHSDLPIPMKYLSVLQSTDGKYNSYPDHCISKAAACDRRANIPCGFRASSPGGPCSTRVPRLNTSSWSQSMIVSIRCAITCAAYHHYHYTPFLPMEARSIHRQAAGEGCQHRTPLWDLSDPSKTQLIVDTVLSIYTAPRQPRPHMRRICKTSRSLSAFADCRRAQNCDHGMHIVSSDPSLQTVPSAPGLGMARYMHRFPRSGIKVDLTACQQMKHVSFILRL